MAGALRVFVQAFGRSLKHKPGVVVEGGVQGSRLESIVVGLASGIRRQVPYLSRSHGQEKCNSGKHLHRLYDAAFKNQFTVCLA